MRSVIIHGHYYQPPRENPWLEQVEAEASAAPYHDWNERIERECYRAVVAARVQASDGRIAGIVNTLAWTSFDVGPTLLDWLEREAPATYRAILDADRRSRERWGHGNALAHPYHHVILPLAPRRDKQTEVRWGVRDFRRRFGRDPEGMWLPETAVDAETLDVLAAEGVRFTVLAPHQVRNAPARGMPGVWRTSSGREIVLFPYDGAISSGVAFGPLTRDAHAWAAALAGPGGAGATGAGARAGTGSGSGDDALAVVATDGETYGHHQRFGEMALARVIEELQGRTDVRIENFASFLARNPPLPELELVPETSWSCSHGLDRWRADCGCRTAPERQITQRWRAPLRRALVSLASDLHAHYERVATPLLGDPWAARDAYGEVVGGDGEGIGGFVARRLPGATEEERVRAREALEMERDLLRLFTSCAWFFDDISGLEPLQVLRYAARAIDLAGPEGLRVEPGFLEQLAEVKSDDPSIGTGRDIYLEAAKRFFPPAVKAAAGWAAARHLSHGPAFAPSSASGSEPPSGLAPVPGLAPAHAHVGMYQVEQHGRALRLTHRRTGRTHSFTAEVHTHGGRHLTVEVRDPAEPSTTVLRYEDLPEREREQVRAGLQRSLVHRSIDAADRTQVGAGIEPLASAAQQSLVRAAAVLAEPGGPTPEAIVRVQDLLALHELLGLGITFDAQTAYWNAREALGDPASKEISVLDAPMGFSLQR